MRPLIKFTLLVFSLIAIYDFSVSAQTPIRVVCVGNSITEGVGASDGAHSYPSQLVSLLGSGYQVYNCGVSARTMLKKGDFPYWNESKFVTAKNTDPNIVIITLGTNDSKTDNWVYKNEYYSDYVAMVTEFRKNGRNPKIFVCFPAPAFIDNYSIQNAVIRDEILPLIDSVAKTQNTSKIDYYHPLLPFGKLFPDGIHPCNQGAVYMAQIAYAAITGIPTPNVWKWDYTDDAAISSTLNNLTSLTDNDEKTLFEINPQGNSTINFDFPHKMNLNGCLFYSADNQLTISDWEIQYSNDKISWTKSPAIEGNPNNKGKVYALTTVPAKYFRLLLKGNNILRINEFQLFGFPRVDEKPLAQYPDDLTGNSVNDVQKGNFTAGDPGLTAFGEVSANAIDGLQNKYTVNGRAMTMTYTFVNPVKVGSYSLAVGSKGNLGRNPMTWKLYAAGADLQYNLIAEEKFFTFPHVDYCSMKFNVPQPSTYLSYRIEIEGAAGESMTHISEWQLFEPEQSTALNNYKYQNNLLANIKVINGIISMNKLSVNDCTYKVFEINGKLLNEGQLIQNTEIDLKSGIYVVKINTSKEIQVQKVILN